MHVPTMRIEPSTRGPMRCALFLPQLAYVLANISSGQHTKLMLVLRRTMNSPTSGEWSDQEFDVFDEDALVGRILRSHAASSDRPWLWMIIGRSPDGVENRGYATSLEVAMSELTSRWEAPDPAR